MIEVIDLSVTFSGSHSVQAVQDVSLSLLPGQKTAVIGETGSGKSVLLLAMLQLLPHSASVSGSVMFMQSTNLLQLRRKDMEDIWGVHIAYVPQGSGASLNPMLRVGFQVAEPLIRHKDFSKKQALAESIALFKHFHIGNESQRIKHFPHMFSGGMKQRALVAMGISAGAKYILADEPTKGLDESKIEQVKDAFLSLEEQSILCVTHDLNFASVIAEDIHVMYASQQVEHAPAAVLLSEPLHPYTQDMINAMPENGLKASHGFAPPNTESFSGCRYRSRCCDAAPRCAKTPPFIQVSDSHKVRCWKYVVAD